MRTDSYTCGGWWGGINRDENGHVTAIILAGLTGSLPAELDGALPYINYLSIQGLAPGGPLPSWIGSLTTLNDLVLTDCNLTGPIPPELGQLTSLNNVLDLSGNHLTGPLPDALSSVHPYAWNMRDNQLSGVIPTWLGYGAHSIWLSYNQFTGSIPPALLASTRYLVDLSYNRLSGALPEIVGGSGIGEVNVSGNHLSGDMPYMPLDDWPHLVLFDCSDNHLQGEVPEALWTGGTFPDWPGMYRLYIMDVVHNTLEGEIPDSIVTWATFPWHRYDVSYNRFSGAGAQARAVLAQVDPDWEAPQRPAQDPTGQNVVAPLGAGASVTYGEVTTSGSTTIVTAPAPSVPTPSGFSMQSVYYHIVTTSHYSSAGLDVTLTYDDRGMTFEQEAAIALLHYENDAWVDCTVSRDATANTVKGHVSSLSWFAIGVGPVLSGPAAPVPVNTSAALTVNLADPDVGDTHTVALNWGDGTPIQIVPLGAGVPSATSEHSYASAGVYTVQATVSDPAGGSASGIYQYIVAYDPEGGFVTGGGWINSPAGAYRADPALVGKATFGFVSKYQKGTNVPSGNTQFQFHAAKLDFRSTSYEWLVVAGSKAKFKGMGTINGAGSYSFMLSAIDGQPDLFRIKITGSGGLVYDNQFGAADDADPTTAIAGGSIVVHKD